MREVHSACKNVSCLAHLNEFHYQLGLKQQNIFMFQALSYSENGVCVFYVRRPHTRGGTPGKIRYGCVARFPKPLPYL